MRNSSRTSYRPTRKNPARVSTFKPVLDRFEDHNAPNNLLGLGTESLGLGAALSVVSPETLGSGFSTEPRATDTPTRPDRVLILDSIGSSPSTRTGNSAPVVQPAPSADLAHAAISTSTGGDYATLAGLDPAILDALVAAPINSLFVRAASTPTTPVDSLGGAGGGQTVAPAPSPSAASAAADGGRSASSPPPVSQTPTPRVPGQIHPVTFVPEPATPQTTKRAAAERRSLATTKGDSLSGTSGLLTLSSLSGDSGGGSELPSVSLEVTDATAAEGGSDNGIFTVTRTGDPSAPLTVYFTVGGTATADDDYTLSSGGASGSMGYVEIPEGATGVAFDIYPVDDSLSEGTESVTLTLQSHASYTIAGSSGGTLDIQDDESGGSGGSGGSGTIGDRVWVDSNANGIQDQGESGLRGVSVRLLDGQAQELARTTTDVEGRYAFAGLAQGTYQIEFVVPPGSNVTGRGQGTDTALDSDADPATARTGLITLSEGQQFSDLDAGLIVPTVTIQTSDASGSEAGPDAVRFTLTRTGGNLSQALPVAFYLGGTTNPLLDYTGVSLMSEYPAFGSVEIPASQQSVTLILTPLQDQVLEGEETILVSLVQPGGPARNFVPNPGGIGQEVLLAMADNPPPANAPGTGLTARYFKDRELRELAIPAKVEAKVDFDWGTGSPAEGVPVSDFSAQWSGQVQPEFSERYTFHVLADDGVRLWVNNQLIVNDWSDHVPLENEGQIVLEAGKKYDIVLEYYEHTGGAVAKLYWSSPSRAKEVIPTARLFPVAVAATPAGTGNGLQGHYYDQTDLKTNLTVRRTDPTVDFAWSTGQPDAAMGLGSFSVRWTGQVEPRVTGLYTFYVEGHNGIRLAVDNQVIIDDFAPGDSSLRERKGTIVLRAGRKYDLWLEFYDNAGAAPVKLSWSSALQAKQVIPQTQLYSPANPDTNVPIQWIRETGTAAGTFVGNDFDLGNGQGHVAVYIDGQIRNNFGFRPPDDPRFITLEFTSTMAPADDCHWLQFTYRYIKDANGQVVDPYYYSTRKGPTLVLYNQGGLNQWRLDTDLPLTNAYYDESEAAHGRSERQISIFDRPGVNPDPLYPGMTESGAVFDSYLVCGSKVMYHVTWKRIGKLVNQAWQVNYVDIAGEPASRLPEWARTNTLLIGYEQLDGTKNPPLSVPRSANNPVPAANR